MILWLQVNPNPDPHLNDGGLSLSTAKKVDGWAKWLCYLCPKDTKRYFPQLLKPKGTYKLKVTVTENPNSRFSLKLYFDNVYVEFGKRHRYLKTINFSKIKLSLAEKRILTKAAVSPRGRIAVDMNFGKCIQATSRKDAKEHLTKFYPGQKIKQSPDMFVVYPKENHD